MNCKTDIILALTGWVRQSLFIKFFCVLNFNIWVEIENGYYFSTSELLNDWPSQRPCSIFVFKLCLIGKIMTAEKDRQKKIIIVNTAIRIDFLYRNHSSERCWSVTTEKLASAMEELGYFYLFISLHVIIMRNKTWWVYSLSLTSLANRGVWWWHLRSSQSAAMRETKGPSSVTPAALS